MVECHVRKVLLVTSDCLWYKGMEGERVEGEGIEGEGVEGEGYEVVRVGRLPMLVSSLVPRPHAFPYCKRRKAGQGLRTRLLVRSHTIFALMRRYSCCVPPLLTFSLGFLICCVDVTQQQGAGRERGRWQP